MAKFGDLIDVEVPVLLEFFTEWDEASNTMHPVLKDVAAALGDKAKVIKIDVEKNNNKIQELEKNIHFFSNKDATKVIVNEILKNI